VDAALQEILGADEDADHQQDRAEHQDPRIIDNTLHKAAADVDVPDIIKRPLNRRQQSDRGPEDQDDADDRNRCRR
jgi:hypothetical protein